MRNYLIFLSLALMALSGCVVETGPESCATVNVQNAAGEDAAVTVMGFGISVNAVVPAATAHTVLVKDGSYHVTASGAASGQVLLSRDVVIACGETVEVIIPAPLPTVTTGTLRMTNFSDDEYEISIDGEFKDLLKPLASGEFVVDGGVRQVVAKMPGRNVFGMQEVQEVAAGKAVTLDIAQNRPFFNISNFRDPGGAGSDCVYVKLDGAAVHFSGPNTTVCGQSGKGFSLSQGIHKVEIIDVMFNLKLYEVEKHFDGDSITSYSVF